MKTSGTLILIFATVFCSTGALAQNGINDKALLQGQSFTEKKYDARKPVFLFKHSRNLLVKYNPATLTFGGLLFFYQKTISPQIGASCPYVISCSNFSKQCIQHYGLLKGMALTADRLTRCTQFTLIDLRPFQLTKDKKIIDPVEQYTFKHVH